MKKFILIIIIFQTNFSYSQPYNKTVDYKKYLLENIKSIDNIEGIWEFNNTMNAGFRDINPKFKSITTPSAKGTLAPYTVAIIKMGDNIYKTFPVIEVIGKITLDNNPCNTYWFKSTSRDNQYIFENGSPCDYSYHNKAYIDSEGDLIFSGDFEETTGSIMSWNNFSIKAIKLTPSASDIRNYKPNN